MHMGRLACVPRNAVWPAIAIALGLLAIAGFVHDLGFRELRSWEVAALLVGGATIALLTLPKESLARALVGYISITASAFLIVYDVLDMMLDPVMKADWPIAILATLVTWGLDAALFGVDLDDD